MKCVVDRKGASTGRLDQESFSCNTCRRRDCARYAYGDEDSMHTKTEAYLLEVCLWCDSNIS